MFQKTGKGFVPIDLTSIKLWIEHFSKKEGLFIEIFSFVVLPWFIYHGLLDVLDLGFAATDVFLFKEAGVRLANEGRFVVSNLLHMPWGEEKLFAYYPPLYPLCFGLWTFLFGLSQTTSLWFDATIRLFKVLAIIFFIHRSHPCWTREKSNASHRRLIFFFLGLLSALVSEGDRPDELALFFGILSLALIKYKTVKMVTVAGFVLGLCASSSPTCAILFALMGTVLVLVEFKNSLKFTSLLAGGSFCTFFLITLPVRVLDPESYQRFQKQIPLSLFPYEIPFVKGGTVTGFVQSFTAIMDQIQMIALPFWWMGLAVMMLYGVLVLRGQSGHQDRWWEYSSLGLLVAFTLAIFFVWSLQPYYLWFVVTVALALVLSKLSQKGNQPVEVVLLLLVIILGPLFFRQSKMVLSGMGKWNLKSNSILAQEVLEKVGSGKLAISAEQYFFFRDRKQIDNVAYICQDIEQYHFLYLTHRTRRTKRPAYPRIDCSIERCFKPLLDLREHKAMALASFKLPYFVHTHGGVLFQNKCLVVDK